MPLAYVDSETLGRVPIQHGTDAYTKTAQPLIWTYALENAPVGIWDMTEEAMPSQFEDIVFDERITIEAHNAPFDRGILTHGNRIPTPIHRWRCTRARSYSHGLPGHLGLLGQVLGLPEDKRKLVEDGKLMHLFCIPDAKGHTFHPTERPEEWLRFKNYAIRDTEALREISKRLPTHNYQGDNLECWWLDQLMNERGFGFDADFATAAVDFLKKAKVKTDADLTDATDDAVNSATQRGRLLKWCIEVKGLNIPNMKAATIRDWLEMDDLDPLVRFVLQTRLEAGKSSGSKYGRGLTCQSADRRMRQMKQFGGAGRTGRWSGKIFQPDNMARPTLNVMDNGRMVQKPVKAKYIDDVIMPGIRSGAALGNDLVFGGPNEAAALALRHTVVAAPGNELVVADFSNVESRDLAWLAGETWKLEAYRAVDRGEGVDLYRLLYSRFFGVPAEKVDDQARQSGKVVELACGFGGGVGAFVTMAAGYSIDLATLPPMVLPAASPEVLKKAERAWRRAFLLNEDYGLDKDVYLACDALKQAYRTANKAINELRHEVDNAVRSAVRTPGSVLRAGRCTIWCNGSVLIIQLPSGRRLNYWTPKLETERDIDPDTGKETQREFITYCTQRHSYWTRERAWSGLFLENIVQASSNCLLRDALRATHRDTLTIPAIVQYLETLPPWERTAISLHVHDEISCDVPKGSYPLDRLLKVITTASPWAVGFPMAAAGWVDERYGKR